MVCAWLHQPDTWVPLPMVLEVGAYNCPSELEERSPIKFYFHEVGFHGVATAPTLLTESISESGSTKWADGEWTRPEEQETTRLIFRAGIKVEVSFEEEVLHGVWFPATIVEDLGNDLFLVEYSSWVNDESKLHRVTVDHLHIRPSIPQTTVTSFGLLEKVDAFVDFGWWSGVITKKLADSRYVVYFKHTNKVKELGHLELRPHVEWKNEKWFTPNQVPVSIDVEHDELRETVSLNFTNTIEDTTTCIDKQTSILATSMKRAKPTHLGSNLKPSKKSKAGNASDDMNLSNGGQSEEVSNLTAGQTDGTAENLSTKKKKLGKREKGVELKRPVITSARKKGRLSADSRGPKTLPKGDLTLATTPNIVEEKHVTSARKKGRLSVDSGGPKTLPKGYLTLTTTPNVVEEKRVTSARKKGRLSVDSGGPETLPKAAGDSTLTTIPNIVEEKHATKIFPIPVIMGLQCYSVTISQSKKPKELTSKSPQNVIEPEAPQSGVPLEPKATDNQERKETDGDTVTKRKRGRPFKSQSKNGKTSLAVNNQNGDASVKKVPYRSGIELTLQQEKYDKPVKGKRAKRRMISLNITSSPQDVQDSSKQIENGNSEINVEKSLDTVSDDQPLSRWFLGKQSLATLESTGKKPPEISKSLRALTNGDGQTLTFEKRSSLWETIESMEAFRLFPQKPHFRPLDSIKESARERHAINKMVDFSGVFEEMRRLRIGHPRTEIEDQLETLSELETYGFDINFIRNRLMELISLKDKREGLESRSKEVKDILGNHRVELQKIDDEIESIDKQLRDLMEKRDRASKDREKKDSEIIGLQAEIDEIEKGMREFCCKFDELATASFV
ncbi:hypothetical protein L1987_13045 [Smallanthus sonchifolius]|uniref:Uncharacterized protein n=1 Tax=Smallanthus sonchifolius TaxID=185202 RepID=A0ACB9JHJ0_9ASTR|nr:hypothetical protein L1987_13045 [Smallanthus sonchifolius]